MGTVLRDEEREFGAAPTRFRLTVSLTDEWPPEENVSAVHCLAFAGDRIVLARHVEREWTIPGGHVEPGETAVEAMRREALEEAGVAVGTPTLRLAPMSRDDRVSIEEYGSSSPSDVARQLVDAAALFTNVLDRLDDDGWGRTLRYSYPVERVRTLRWLAVHTGHEVHHHLADVRGA